MGPTRYLDLLRDSAARGEARGGRLLARALALADVIQPDTPRPPDSGEITESPDAWADGGGHVRPFYRPLASYAVGLARRLGSDAPPLEDAGERPVPPDAPTAARGAEWCAAVWGELAGCVGAGEPAVGPVARRLLDGQHRDGAFFAFDRTGGDNPEPWWYHELVALHAICSLARLTGSADADAAWRRAADFHAAETQPDHATGQPWALNAFMLVPDHLPTADLLLLAAGVGRGRGIDVVSRILLADAAVWLDDDLARRASLTHA